MSFKDPSIVATMGHFNEVTWVKLPATDIVILVGSTLNATIPLVGFTSMPGKLPGLD